MTKEEAIASFVPMNQEVILVELEQRDVGVTAPLPSLTIVRPDFTYDKERDRVTGEIRTVTKPVQKFNVCYGRVVKKYEPEEGEEIDDKRFNRLNIGSLITFMPYAAPEGTFDEYPELRIMSMNDVIALIISKKKDTTAE